MRALSLLLVGALGLAAAEVGTWRPHDHPAIVTREIPGVTHPLRALDLATELGGRVLEMLVEEGETVPDEGDGWGSVLLLDPRLTELELARSKAAVAETGAAIATAEAQHAIAEREASYHVTELKRISTLVEQDRLSQRELDAATFEAGRAQLRVRSAEAAIASSRAHRDTAWAQVDEIAERLIRHRLRAPAGWIVSQRLVEAGTMVQPGNPVLRLHDVRRLEVPLRLDEDELRALGKSVQLQFPAFDHVAEARLDRVDVTFDPASRKRLAVLSLDGADAPVASGGLMVTATLPVPLAENGVLVPERFVIRGQKQMMVELSDGRRIPVVPLRESEGQLVLSGDALTAGAELRLPAGGLP